MDQVGVERQFVVPLNDPKSLAEPSLPPALTRDESNFSFLPIITEACEQSQNRITHSSAPTLSNMWIEVESCRGATPQQGWKLHVSAGISSATEVLRAALPILLAEKVSFKVAASLRVLEYLNEGNAGLSQIGKFITVYPQDDMQAVRLATTLNGVTRGLRGPAVPSDRPLVKGSLVFYRYGGFDGRHVQNSIGAIVSAISTPGGELVEDQRLVAYRSPEWVEDPFLVAGVAAESKTQSPEFICGRFLPIAMLHRSFRGTVHLAIDIDTPRRCVLKRAWRDAMLDRDGRDARDNLRHEAAVLSRLAPDSRFPAVYDLVEQDGDLFLVLEDMEGQTLEEHVAEFSMRGCHAPPEQIVDWGRQLVRLLETIHAQGLIYGDLKSANVIIAPSGQLRLLDFGSAYDISGHFPPFGKGTVGYMSPQRERDELPTIADDIYGLGALLFFIATGAEPSQRPSAARRVGRRNICLLNPNIGAGLTEVIATCLRENPADRYSSMRDLDTALRGIEPTLSVDSPAFGLEVLQESETEARTRVRMQAQRLLDTLGGDAIPATDGSGLFWISRHEGSGGFLSCDISTGTGGSLLALAELVGEFGNTKHWRTLAEAARWLASSQSAARSILPGLYVGEAGVGAALLRAGQLLDDDELVAAAADRGRRIAKLPYVSPDVYNGTAGRLLFHLLLWDQTGEEEHLKNAIEAGMMLLAAAESVKEDESRWRIPPGYEGLSGCANLGYAHGAAGIADVLLDLFEATHDERFLVPAQRAGRWLQRLAVPVLEDGSGLAWPSDEDEQVFPAMWCHGASGIARFFLHADHLGALPNAQNIAQGAARSVARGARWAGPTQCHGLAGNIELLLDMFQATGDGAYLNEARSLGSILQTFASERNGRLVWPSEEPTVTSPDYMVGYAGVALCLLRLSDPERLPHQLSRAGFRHRPKSLGAAATA